MKFKKLGLSILSLAVGSAITACNSGSSNSGPTTANYGALISESSQNLGVYASIQNVLFPIMLQAGNYGTESKYEIANAKNTESAYNFSTSPTANYFKASMIKAYSIEYNTPGQNADSNPSQIVRTASGLIIVPQMNTGEKLRGVVVYFHPTTFGKNEVPSCLGPIASGQGNMSSNVPSYCNVTSLDNTGAATLAMLSAIYAARGFAVVAPDYVGQGSDWNNVHPYVVYPENNVLSAFNMFPSLRKILNDNGVDSTQNLPLFITGYSEGGGYALKASQMAQGSAANLLATNNLTLKITSPQEGAYSLVDQMNFAFNDNNDGMFNCSLNSSYNCGNVNMMQGLNSESVTPEVLAMNSWNVVSAPSAAGYKPALTSYVLTAAMTYNFNNLSNAYDFAMNPQFWSNINMGGGVFANFYQLYSGIYGSKYTGSKIGGAIVSNTFNINNYDPVTSPTITSFSALFSTESTVMPPNHYGTNNAATSFINQGLTTNPIFQNILANGSTFNWKTSSPINFIHMVYDSAVTVLNTHEAYSCMKNGLNFTGNNGMVSSQGVCTTAPSGNMVESTIIQNFQLTNNLNQQQPMALVGKNINTTANSKFWTKSSTGVAILGTPYDHGDMFVLGSIVALCTFENQLANNNTNSGICPTLN